VVVVIDYRPALRARTGVGEYVHELVAALGRSARPSDELHYFTSSLRDRLDPAARRDLAPARGHDLRVPVRGLNWSWHRFGWPPVETLVHAPADVVHAAHPLVIPSRRAAQVVTIHDLDFLDHPERTSAEIRRDYARLAPAHAQHADAVLTSSRHTAGAIVERLGVREDRVTVCPPGPPRWTAGERAQARRADGYVLFIGTLDPRKNLETLLDGYKDLVTRLPDAPPLKLVGAAGRTARPWLTRIAKPPLAGRVEYLGYVADDRRRGLFEGASVLVIPSWHEGFGLPALEAMSLGVPVVASRRGALPEVLGGAGLLFDPADRDALSCALERVLTDGDLAADCIAKGLQRSASWSWDDAALRVRQMYAAAMTRRSDRNAHRR
jgi:glycosyltransferase involved in cell wall biosynthesis